MKKAKLAVIAAAAIVSYVAGVKNHNSYIDSKIEENSHLIGVYESNAKRFADSAIVYKNMLKDAYDHLSSRSDWDMLDTLDARMKVYRKRAYNLLVDACILKQKIDSLEAEIKPCIPFTSKKKKEKTELEDPLPAKEELHAPRYTKKDPRLII